MLDRGEYPETIKTVYWLALYLLYTTRTTNILPCYISLQTTLCLHSHFLQVFLALFFFIFELIKVMIGIHHGRKLFIWLIIFIFSDNASKVGFKLMDCFVFVDKFLEVATTLPGISGLEIVCQKFKNLVGPR